MKIKNKNAINLCGIKLFSEYGRLHTRTNKNDEDSELDNKEMVHNFRILIFNISTKMQISYKIRMRP